jgi:hypothetical protein
MTSYVDLDSPEMENMSVFPWLQQPVAPVATMDDGTYPKVREIANLRPLIAEANLGLKPAGNLLTLASGKKDRAAALLKEHAFAPVVLKKAEAQPKTEKPAKNLFDLAASEAKSKDQPAPPKSAPAQLLPPKAEAAAVKAEAASKTVLKKKDPHANGYNLDLILMQELFIPADQRTYDKSMGHIKAGKALYSKLDDITRLSRILRDANKDHPKEVDLSKNEAALSLLDKMREYGLVEKTAPKPNQQGEEKTEDKPKTVFTDREIEVIIANLETESKILPNKAQVEFAFVGPLREQAAQVMRIVSKALELDNKLVERALSRIRGA